MGLAMSMQCLYSIVMPRTALQVLTDLGEHWQLTWMHDDCFCHYTFQSAEAVATFADDSMSSAELGGDPEDEDFVGLQ